MVRLFIALLSLQPEDTMYFSICFKYGVWDDLVSRINGSRLMAVNTQSSASLVGIWRVVYGKYFESRRGLFSPSLLIHCVRMC